MIGSSTDISTDDASLLAASHAGDVAAFGELVERYHNLVCAIAYSRTGDRIASEDIAQETFLAAWRGLAGLRDPHKLRPWLCGIARNLAGKTLRRRRRERLDEVEDLEGQLAGDPGPLTAMLSRERETTVWAALEQLPATYREPLVLFYREQQSIKQVALGLGLTEETAKQRLSRGRLSLRENIGDLVEQTLQAGRPRKAAAAAVVAAIVAAQGTGNALAATQATRGMGRRRVLAGAGGIAGVAAAVAVFVATSRGPEEARSADVDRNDARITELRRAHAAWQTSTPGARTCELRGRVARTDGTVIAGALVTLVEHSWQATALEPLSAESDARGQWMLSSVRAGSYTVSVSAPGARATTRLVTCAGSGTDVHDLALHASGALLRGSVHDAGGGPIAGAMVWVLDPAGSSTVFVTRTQADGAYEIIVPPGRYVALLMHPDYALEVRPVTLGERSVREDVTLLPGASIEGTVVDHTGAPVAEAKVTTLARTPRSERAPARGQMAAVYGALLPVVTDAHGRFRLRGLPPGDVELTARMAKLVTAEPPSVTIGLAEQASGALIRVAAARTLSGFVVARGAEARGVRGVQLVAFREDAPLGLPVIAMTDGAGHFELAGLTPGAYWITASAAGFAPHVHEHRVTVEDAADTLVVLERGTMVRGRLEPGQAAVVKLEPARAARSTVSYIKAAMTRAEVDDHGRFTFPAVAPGDYVISATSFEARGEQPLRVAAREQAVQLTLQPRSAITGTVVDDAGAKLAGVLVNATSSRPLDPVAALHTTVRTDEHGAYTIVGVTAGRHQLRVFDDHGQRPWAHAPRRAFRPRVVEVPATGSITEILEVARRGGRLTGRVVGVDRRPIGDAWITVHARDASRRPALFPSAPVLTDAAGRFAVEGVFGAELVVEAADGAGTQRAVMTAANGADVELELRPLATLVGKVARDGHPAAAFAVRLRHASSGVSHHHRGVAGSFSLSAMAGDHELVVTSELGYARRSIAVGEAPTTAVDVALEAWGTLRGRVVGADGEPWIGARLILAEDLEASPRQTDSGGAFTFDRVPAGRHELMIVHATDRDGVITMELELASGQALDLDVIRPGRQRSNAEVRVPPARQTTASASADLGLQLFVAVAPPTAATLAAVKTDPRLASREGQQPNAALWIVAVDPGSPAARAGLRPGDRVAGVGMTKVEGGEAAVEMMMSLTGPWRSRGRAVPWTILRGGRELRVEVVVPN